MLDRLPPLVMMLAQMYLEILQIRLPTPGIRHKVKRLRPELRNNRVVDDPTTTRLQQAAQRAVVLREPIDTRRRDLEQEFLRAGPVQVVLHHVRDVEEGGFLARPVVRLGVGEVGVLEGHGVAAEGDHFGAVAHVEVVEVCSFWIES
jgi:hypothetical protein